MAVPVQSNGENGENDRNERQESEDENEEIICNHMPGVNGVPPSNPPPPPEGNKDETALKVGLKATAAAGTAAVAVPVAGTAGLTALGFTSSGIAAGSFAAGTQAAIGNVVAGSAFATFQSIGATGGFAILGPVGLISGAVVGGGYLAYKLIKSSTSNQGKEDKKNDDNSKPAPPLGYAIRGVTVCEECWLRMQQREFKRFEKEKKEKEMNQKKHSL